MIFNWTVHTGRACCRCTDPEEHSPYPLHPEIIVTLTGEDNNAFAVLGYCRQAAREADLSEDELAALMAEAMAGDCDHLLQTVIRWFEIR